MSEIIRERWDRKEIPDNGNDREKGEFLDR